jgi:hypothetical protein
MISNSQILSKWFLKIKIYSWSRFIRIFTVKPWKKTVTFCSEVKNCEKIEEFEFSFLVLCKKAHEWIF